ncbi:MAG: FAD-dependent oxidoreductase [Longimicrobiales bacterium]
MTRTVDHLVVGAGIVGVSIAEALAREGAEVLVVDRGDVGRGCSEANAGWVTPCFAMPLPRPGLMGTALRWMADPDSPFYMQPRPTPSRLRWLLRFGMSMGRRDFVAGTGALVELSRYSLDAYAALDDALPGRIGLQRRGLMMVALTTKGYRAARSDAEMLAGLGIRSEMLDAEGARRLEPALTGEVAGVVYYPDEAHLQPLAAVQTIAERARSLGARFEGGAEVFDFVVAEGRVREVRTTRGPIEAARVVLATGSWSSDLARRLGLRVPLLGGKGYSMMIQAPTPPPEIPMMVLERKVAITPYGDDVRLAGTLELVDGDDSISPRRVASIRRGAAAVLGIPESTEADRVWRGLRPCTPDGLPIIGPARAFDNVFIATGHQMLGVQTGPATGRLACDLLLGREPAFDPTPFRTERFR